MNTAPMGSGRYQILNRIGEGGMGAVFRALDRRNGRIVALKQVEVNPEYLQTPGSNAGMEARLAITQEFRTLATLRHPNIISVLDYGFDERGQPFFTMDLLDDPEDICTVGQRGDDKFKINLLIQALQALSYLHRRQILHRDLKPGNVLVTQDGVVKLLDFGLAVEQSQIQETVGTLAYMAPEVLKEEPATPATDLYALGILAYEMFALHYPYNLDDVMELLKDILKSTPDLSRLPQLDVPARPHTIGLRDIIHRLTAPETTGRYQHADDVIADLCEAIAQPIPQDSVEIRESYLQSARFVGREAELVQLTNALDDARDGKGSAWLIGGESGVGKSRLVEQLQIRALVNGVAVLHGQSEDTGGLPYKLWRNPIKDLLLSTQISDIDASILKEIVPEIDQIVGRTIKVAADVEADNARQRLIRSIVFVFRQQKRPILLVLEDLQWSRESLQPLQHLTQAIEELPLMIVANYRDDERPDLPDTLPTMNHIKLERLSKVETAQLSQSILGETGAQSHIIDLLQRETEGNAFFLVEVIRALAEDAGSLQNIGRVTLPGSVFSGGIQRVVESRLNGVPEVHRPLLHIAAIAGRSIDKDVLAQIAGESDVEHWITACSNAAVLTVRDGRWYFSHDKLREGVLNQMDDDTRKSLHNKVAAAIEQVYMNMNTEEQAVRLAYHYNAAGNLAKAGEYATIAGLRELRHGNYAEAINLIERAIQLDDQADKSMTAALLWNLGKAHWGLGNFDDAELQFNESLTLYRAAEDQEGIAEALVGLGDVTRRRGALDEAKAFFQEALALSTERDDTSAMALAYGRLGVIARNRGDFDAAETNYLQALKLYESIGEVPRSAGIYSGLGLVASDQGQHAKARRYYEQSLEMTRSVGNRTGIALVLTGLSWVLYMDSKFAEARVYCEESLEISRDVGDRWMVANNLGNLGKILIELEDYSGAKQQFKEALTLSARIEAIPLFLEILPGLAKLLDLTGDTETAIKLLVFALNHPATYIEVEYQAQPLLDSIERRLDSGISIALKQAGQTLDFTTILGMLQE